MAGYGMIPAYHLTGGVIRLQEYSILSTLAENIFTGDIVNAVDSGLIEPTGGGEDYMLGVFAGVQYVDASGNMTFSRYWPSGTTATEIKAYVYTDPQIVYKIQADQDTNPLVFANKWSNGAIIATAGSTVTGQSGFVLDSSDVVANDSSAAEEQLQFLGSAQLDAGFTSAGTTMDAYVRFNQHVYLGGTLAASAGL